MHFINTCQPSNITQIFLYLHLLSPTMVPGCGNSLQQVVYCGPVHPEFTFEAGFWVSIQPHNACRSVQLHVFPPAL